jgi:hypothetical protein
VNIKANRFLLFVLIAALLTASCGKESGQSSVGEVSPSVVDVYLPPEGNLLINADFELEANGAIHGWKLTQHTGPISYKVSVENKEVRLERIDKEPWGVFSQTLRSKAVVPMQGKRLRFSAELKADFTGEYGPPFQVAGLSVMVTGVMQGAPGRKTLVDLIDPVDMDMSGKGWQRRSVEFEVPDSASAGWLDMRLGIIMTHGGNLSIRRPYLIAVDN